jgi:ABC-type sugar transport system ATPase subunit
MVEQTTTKPPLLELRSIQKHFGGVRALRGANFRIRSGGEVHGLIGQNGCGKSTLLGVLSGQVRPDAGEIHIDGHRVDLATPAEAIKHGIVMVSQELALAPQLSVAENIFMGRRFATGPAGIDWRRTRAAAQEILRRLDLDIDPATLVGTLSPDRQQMVEVARALSMNARVLILDEPTSSLGVVEVQSLFRAIRSVAADGIAVIFVSHKLPEMLEIADDVTVLREGETVASASTGTFDATSLVAAMVGTAVDAVASAPQPTLPTGTPHEAHALQLENLTVAGCFEGVSLHARPGEIVGVAGLSGAGRSELLETIFGMRRPDAGVMTLDGRVHAPRNPRASIESGVGYLPPDRKTQGLVLRLSITDNMAMAATMNVSRLRPPRLRRIDALVAAAMRGMQVKAPNVGVAVGTLSGGGQQKVALGKWSVAASGVLLLDEPTRGVDVSAKREIHTLLRRAAAEGTTMIVSSSENAELLELCDRILVMVGGRVVADVEAASTDEARLGLYSGGVHQ